MMNYKSSIHTHRHMMVTNFELTGSHMLTRNNQSLAAAVNVHLTFVLLQDRPFKSPYFYFPRT